MKATFFHWAICICSCVLLVMAGCDNKRPATEHQFTKADSVTEVYLALHDSLLLAWNSMIHDDNRKIKSMQHLVHELMTVHPEKKDELEALDERLKELVSMRFDQQSLSDADIISEYDFVSNSLVSELLSLAESQIEFPYNTTIQKLTDSIRSADQRVMNYRVEYDMIASRYNSFLEKNRSFLKEIDPDSLPGKKPLFEMAAD